MITRLLASIMRLHYAHMSGLVGIASSIFCLQEPHIHHMQVENGLMVSLSAHLALKVVKPYIGLYHLEKMHRAAGS